MELAYFRTCIANDICVIRMTSVSESKDIFFALHTRLCHPQPSQLLTYLSVGRTLLLVLVTGWLLFSLSWCYEEDRESEQLHKFHPFTTAFRMFCSLSKSA